ncbi:MAG TPA: arsenic resistance N-acetyltransferase ArsN2 [Gammaproteobacteria bacterium]
MSEIVLAPFSSHDEATMGLLLEAADLSTEDITPGMLEHFKVAHLGPVLVGCAGLDVQGEAALLRSVAVDEAHRGLGLGKRLVQAMEDHAREEGVRELYLLTTTAEAFFAGLDYRKLPRSEAPAGIAATEQFAGLCPSSSSFMAKTLIP